MASEGPFQPKAFYDSCMAESLVQRDCECYAGFPEEVYDKQSSNTGYWMFVMCL